MWIRTDRHFVIPAEVKACLTQLIDAGFEAYLVGGCVRDVLLNRAVKDYDIATNANPSQIESLFEKTVGVGRAFGVIKVITPAREIEIATFRSDGEYQDGRRPETIQFSTIDEDAKRRDFTMNALYYDFKTNQIYDAHGGLNDLEQKLVRAIGDPRARFSEDALRLLRAVRFSARFEFSIHDETLLAAREQAANLRNISVERIRDEILLMLTSHHSREAIVLLDDLWLLEECVPEVALAKREYRRVWEQTKRTLAALDSHEQKEVDSFYWGLFLLPTLRLKAIEKRDEEARLIASRLKLSSQTSDEIAYLVRETPKFSYAFSMRDATLYRFMKSPHFEMLMRFHEKDAVSYDGNQAGLEFVRNLYPDMQKKFAMKMLVTGDDLVKWGLKPGRQFAEILSSVEDLAIEGKLQTHEQAMEYVISRYVD